MAKQDILNPKAGFDSDVADSMNPDFGWSRRASNSAVTVKAAGGRPMDLETQNDGHTFTLSFTNRSLKCVKRVERFAKQFRRGFFTMLDHEDRQNDGQGEARQYLGRITSAVEVKNASFGKYTIEGITFEEVPTMAMVSYPNNWNSEGISLYARDDFGDLQLVCEGAWTSDVVSDEDGNPLYELMRNAGTAGEWAQYEYKGFGFRLFCVTGPDCGKAGVYLDGVLIETIDLFADVATGPVPIFEYADVPLDFHRVKLVATGEHSEDSTDTKVNWHKLEVLQ